MFHRQKESKEDIPEYKSFREERRQKESKEDRRERKRMFRKRIKKSKKLEFLASLRWQCRYLDNVKYCKVESFGYCGKDGLRCRQVCVDKRACTGSERVLGKSDFNPFDFLSSML
jgi:hypothetical protein